MNKKRLFCLILILALLLVSNCYSEGITEYNYASEKDKNVEKNVSVTCLTRQDYVSVQKNKCPFPLISAQEIPNIDKPMIIQGNSAIDPHMLIPPPSYICQELNKIATPSPNNK